MNGPNAVMLREHSLIMAWGDIAMGGTKFFRQADGGGTLISVRFAKLENMPQLRVQFAEHPGRN